MLLLRLAHDETRQPTTSSLGVKISQRVLGELIGGSREGVNKQLQEWKRAGIITIEKGSIGAAKVVDGPGLRFPRAAGIGRRFPPQLLDRVHQHRLVLRARRDRVLAIVRQHEVAAVEPRKFSQDSAGRFSQMYVMRLPRLDGQIPHAQVIRQFWPAHLADFAATL